MLFSIIACVLAIVVPLVAGLVLRMSVQNELLRMDRMQSADFLRTRATWTTSLEQLTARIATVEKLSSESTNAHLAREVADLAADLAALSKTVRKNFGRVYAELHQDGALQRNEERQQDVETPDQIRARLRAAHGMPKLGNGAAAPGDEE